MKCPKCGFENTQNANFCANCAQPLYNQNIYNPPQPIQPNPAYNYQMQKKPNKDSKIIVALVVGAVVLSICIVCLLIGLGKSPKEDITQTQTTESTTETTTETTTEQTTTTATTTTENYSTTVTQPTNTSIRSFTDMFGISPTSVDSGIQIFKGNSSISYFQQYRDYLRECGYTELTDRDDYSDTSTKLNVTMKGKSEKDFVLVSYSTNISMGSIGYGVDCSIEGGRPDLTPSHPTCAACAGAGTVYCDTCSGTGRQVYYLYSYMRKTKIPQYRTCPLCSGSGRKKCLTCNGKGYTY